MCVRRVVPTKYILTENNEEEMRYNLLRMTVQSRNAMPMVGNNATTKLRGLVSSSACGGCRKDWNARSTPNPTSRSTCGESNSPMPLCLSARLADRVQNTLAEIQLCVQYTKLPWKRELESIIRPLSTQTAFSVRTPK